MMDEMICAFDSPGSMSAVLIIALLLQDPTHDSRRQPPATNNGKCPAEVSCALGRSELVGCGVRLGAMAAASLNR